MSLKVLTLTLGVFETNCFIVYETKNKEGFVIDPGDASDYICQILLEKEISLKKIIATHGHSDHITAVFDLKLIYGCPFYMNRRDEFLLNNLKYYTHLVPRIDYEIGIKDKLFLGEYTLEIIETPGHTPGSICLYEKVSKILFVGDLIFEGGLFGGYDHKYSSLKELRKSIKKILSKSDDTKVYPGHGPETDIYSLKTLLKSNGFV